MEKELETREEIIKRCREKLEILTPDDISRYSVMLSGYLSEMSEKVAKATREYYQEWCRYKDICDTNGETENRSKATEQYYNKKLLTLQCEATIEMIQALKRRTLMLSDESKGQY